MTLRRLKSSTVESAGFEDGTIRVLFLSGHWHDYTGRSAEDFEDLLAAESPGRFVRERLVGRPASNARQPLDTYEPDDCCSSKLAKALRSNKLDAADAVFECPTCGVEWAPEATAAAGRHWKPRVWTAVLR